MKDYYNILQVNRDAGQDEIRQSFRRLSMQYHPDRHAGGGKYYEEKFKELNEAYQVLKDPIRHWQYKQDSQRRPEPGPGTPGPGAWQTPDYAAKYQRPHRKAQPRRKRPEQSAQQSARQGGGGGSLFWSTVLALVLFLPFAMAGRAPAATASSTATAQGVSYSQSDEFTDYQVQLNRRYHSELSLLRDILASDPYLDGLDRETGFYELDGESFQFSWEMMEMAYEVGSRKSEVGN